MAEQLWNWKWVETRAISRSSGGCLNLLEQTVNKVVAFNSACYWKVERGGSILHNGWMFSDPVSTRVWVAELTDGYSAKEVPQQSEEDTTCFLLIPYSEM
jgi:hypothetical protein